MRTKVHKWGNSLALRIPSAFALQAALTDNAEVDMRVVDGALVVSPVVTKSYQLDDLLSLITDENLHDEHFTGRPAGKEIW